MGHVTGTALAERTPAGGLLIAWQLKDRPVLLIGGGEVAVSRVVHLYHAYARITLLAPRAHLHPTLAAWIEAGVIATYIPDWYTNPSQLERKDGNDDYAMIFTAIDDMERSQEVCDWCRARKIPVNVADVPASCDFYFGSMIRRGPLQVMVSTGGQGPRLARLLRQRIESALPPAVGAAITNVGLLRSKLREAEPAQALSGERMAWMSKVCDTLTLDELAALSPSTAQHWIHHDWPQRRVPRRSRRSWQTYMPCRQSVGSFVLGSVTTMILYTAWAYRRSSSS
ncbi:Bifunctional dehydrogenase and ferrochelatase [Malassezia pachydermatis]|uniref:precorrin-2 dehydrogenase n=1 Tax=Malassezia pachydermatis TaxID=77020 RepID=A0A0M9VR02_9BASI|nr:siroheme synthase [Malassezia pachydermatis]KOS16052.1 siroheme synthase [Malassezia pachydermatis]